MLATVKNIWIHFCESGEIGPPHLTKTELEVNEVLKQSTSSMPWNKIQNVVETYCNVSGGTSRSAISRAIILKLLCGPMSCKGGLALYTKFPLKCKQLEQCFSFSAGLTFHNRRFHFGGPTSSNFEPFERTLGSKAVMCWMIMRSIQTRRWFGSFLSFLHTTQID